MTIQQPQSTDKLNAPDHSLSHRVFANDDASPVQAIVVDSNGRVGIGTVSPDRLLHSEVSDAVTAAVTYGQRISHITSGTAAASFGTGIEFELEGADTTNLVAGAIEVIWTDASTGAEDSDMIFKTSLAGAIAAERVRIDSAGNVNITGLTASEIVITDSSKNLVSAAVATYPSLTELSYVKGVTSAIQTQLGTKVTSGGALGTPSSGTLTNCSGLPVAGITASTTTALGVGSIELGHVSDTTIARSAAGAITVEGVQVILSGAALGTPASGTLTNCTGLPVAGITASTTTALGVGSIELGHASDTTIARSGAGVVTIEGVEAVTVSATQTLSSKTLTAPKIANAGFIADANGNEQIIFNTTSSAVNEVAITNAATGTSGPLIQASGETNVDLRIAGKGTGAVHVTTGSYGDITADTDGATITFNLATSNLHTVTLGGNRTLALSNTHVGQTFIIRLVQDGSGSRTVTWFTTIKWAGGSAPTLTTTSNKTDVFGFVVTSSGNYDGFVVGQNL